MDAVVGRHAAAQKGGRLEEQPFVDAIGNHASVAFEPALDLRERIEVASAGRRVDRLGKVVEALAPVAHGRGPNAGKLGDLREGDGGAVHGHQATLAAMTGPRSGWESRIRMSRLARRSARERNSGRETI